MTDTAVYLLPWPPAGDLDLLRRNNVPELMNHLGGPESVEKLISRDDRYTRGWSDRSSFMFRIVLADVPQGVGAIGYWPREWQGADVYEAGWSVEPQHHGRGIASRALTLVLQHAAGQQDRAAMHAFPKLENAPSNAICVKAGFVLAGECEFEYPPGNQIRCNDWVYDLSHHPQ